MKLIGIGDNVCDAYLHLSTMYPGGQALNVAVYAKMLGSDSAYMGVFGQDEVSEHIQKTLQELKVPYSHSRHYNGPNGYAKVTLVKGERIFLGSNKGGVTRLNPLVFTENDLTYIKQFGLVHTSNNSFLDSQLQKLYENNIPISYDFSRQWLNHPEWVQKIAPYCTFAFCSLPDRASGDEILTYCSSFTNAGARIVIATLGSAGAYYYDGYHLLFEPSRYVDPVDTLGAGDSYAACFLVNYCNGLKSFPAAENDFCSEAYLKLVKSAMARASEFASNTCLVLGAFGHGKQINAEYYQNKEIVE